MVSYINETITGMFNQQDFDELYSQVDSSEQKFTDFGQHCQSGPSGQYLKYIGTSSTVRDLVSLGDAIVGEGEPIDYYGVSYGTVIGFNFVNSRSFRSLDLTVRIKSAPSVPRGTLSPS